MTSKLEEFSKIANKKVSPFDSSIEKACLLDKEHPNFFELAPRVEGYQKKEASTVRNFSLSRKINIHLY